MRYGFVLVVMAFSTAALAQQSSHHPPAPPPQPPPQQAPRSVPPPMVMPLPPLPQQPAGGLTTPSPFVTPASPTNPPRDLFRVDGSHARPPHRSSFGFLPFGGYGYSPYVVNAEPTTAPPPPEAPGMLRFAVTPASAQVFVDSYYAGTISDIDAQRVLTLAPGPHRVEIRAQDYQPVAFDVRLDPNATITYRAALEPLAPPPPARAASGPNATKMYVISNCYLGNVPPRADRLPAGCDAKKVRVVGQQ